MGIIQKQKDLYICFVDFKKAFDTVKHELLVETLRRFGIDGAHIRIITKFYWEQRAGIRVDDDRSGWVNIEKRVRQGGILSVDLFSVYTQLAWNELAELDGIKIGRRKVSNIRYVGDKVFPVDAEKSCSDSYAI